jgi:hypothetical protein
MTSASTIRRKEPVMSLTRVISSGSAALLGAFVLLAASAHGPTATPAYAQGLSGSWSGNGTVTFPSGEKERARCRVQFSGGSSSVTMNAVCATTSARVVQTASLSRVSSNTYSGEFHNAEYGVTGTIRVRVSGRSASAVLNGGGAMAHLNLSR